jgi:polyisoprenyl-phosphate glycosyltransferase
MAGCGGYCIDSCFADEGATNGGNAFTTMKNTAGETAAPGPVPVPETDPGAAATVHDVSVVVPVYQGELTLAPLTAEIEPLTRVQQTPAGRKFRVAEVVLVHDGATDNSDAVMESLADRYPFVKLIWLARNFGQHAATLAGAASSTSSWVVTMDEDGEQNPADLGRFLDKALDTGSQLVYAMPENAPSHGRLRNLMSALTKRFLIYVFVSNAAVARFHSFRLIDGEIARSLAAYCGHNVYLDVALSWVVARTAHCPVVLRNPQRRGSGYSYRRLASHFWRLVLTAGTRPLRVVSLLGVGSILFGAAFSVHALWGWLHGNVAIQGWTTLAILLCFFSGGILFSLGVVAEYLGMALSTILGRPLYVVVSRPRRTADEPP